MKRNKIVLFLASLCVSGAWAQDVYKVDALSGTDLNGTARYVGMGGAMNALGADISTMATNPAAIGLYRRSDVAFTGSATIQPNGTTMGDLEKARGSFDQAGFVYSVNTRGGKLKYLNFGFNYQKRRNLKSYVGLDGIGLSGGLSQSWQMYDLAFNNGAALDLRPEQSGSDYTTPLTVLGYDTQMIIPVDADGNVISDNAEAPSDYAASEADRYNYHRAQWGGIKEYDFNISFNHNNQVYGGITFGVYDVDMNTLTQYDERLYDASGVLGAYNLDYSEQLSGTGFDVKAGFILRPIEDNPFRIGFSFATPIFFDLTQNAYLYMSSPYPYYENGAKKSERTDADVQIADFDYRVRTPWRVNLSLATTVGKWLALDAEYEVAKCNGSQVRWPDYETWDYEWRTTSKKDVALCNEIKNNLQAQHTFRIGAEAKLAEGVYGRVGYNFVSKSIKDDAYLNLFTNSPSYIYSANTDYVNLGAINRVTLGLGVRGKHFYADAAYQFQAQKGTVFAFDVTDESGRANMLQGQEVDLNRHNIMLTLGYKF